MKTIHGGDIYRNQVTLDFSVNVNPLGMPKAVEAALQRAVKNCGAYPDPQAEALRQMVGRKLSVPREMLLFGNGASELFMAIVHGTRPETIGIPVPSFYGYEYAANAVDSQTVFFPLKESDGFLPGQELLDRLTEKLDLLFLANPNNPTGRMLEKAYVKELLERCREKKILVVLDECFVEFCEETESMVSECAEYQNLLVVRAFTKFYAVPGVRLGYLVCSDEGLLRIIEKQLPEWNLSVFAQAAGAACMGQEAYEKETISYVKGERQFLQEGLEKLGLRVFPGEADFLLFYSQIPVYERLLKKGILIRDCENFRGLTRGYYRIAVKRREDNERLLKAIGECVGASGKAETGRD